MNDNGCLTFNHLTISETDIRWKTNNHFHRDNDLPSWINETFIEYRINGKFHRINAPSYIVNNCICYLINNKRHRDTGAAVISIDIVEYYMYDRMVIV